MIKQKYSNTQNDDSSKTKQLSNTTIISKNDKTSQDFGSPIKQKTNYLNPFCSNKIIYYNKLYKTPDIKNDFISKVDHNAIFSGDCNKNLNNLFFQKKPNEFIDNEPNKKLINTTNNINQGTYRDIINNTEKLIKSKKIPKKKKIFVNNKNFFFINSRSGQMQIKSNINTSFCIIKNQKNLNDTDKNNNNNPTKIKDNLDNYNVVVNNTNYNTTKGQSKNSAPEDNMRNKRKTASKYYYNNVEIKNEVEKEIPNTTKAKYNTNIFFDSTKLLPLTDEEIYKLINLKNILNDLREILYVINNDSMKFILNNDYSIKYSNEQDYNIIINENLNDKIILAQKLLELKERKWYDELIDLSIYLEKIRKNIENNMDGYLGKIIKIYEDFSWLVNSIGLFYLKKVELNDEIDLPEINSPFWDKGFKWKGLFIYKQSINDSKHILNEIKSLNYFFLDYLQIIQRYNDELNDEKIILSNNIIFPLVGYNIINNFVIYVSVLINPDNSSSNELCSLQKIVNSNEGFLEFYSNIQKNETTKKIFVNLNNDIKKCEKNNLNHLDSKYYIKDLQSSGLFTNVDETHFIQLQKGKLLFINAHCFIPDLFELEGKNENIVKYNFYSCDKNKKYYYSLNFNKFSKCIISSNFKDSIELKTPKDILTNIYHINLTSDLKHKDIFINSLHFRIIYKNEIPFYNKKNFVNYLNFYENEEKYIIEPYVIIYDLADTCKLDYSLIKSHKRNKSNLNVIKSCNMSIIKINELEENKDEKEIITSMFFLYTNYVSYFLNFCKMMNKNSFNIKRYTDLKNLMKKFGINTNLRYFALFNIDNDEITDIIKVSILIKIIKFVLNKNQFFDKKNILLAIKSILYPHEINNNNDDKYIQKFYEEIFFYMNVLFIKYKLINDYLFLGVLNNPDLTEYNSTIAKKHFISPENSSSINLNKLSDFLENIIYTARKKPFLFISDLETKLNFIIDPFIKFKCSLSLESMHKKLNEDHILLNPNSANMTFSFINSNEISGMLLAQIIYKNNNYFYDDSFLEINESNNSQKTFNNLNEISENNNFSRSNKNLVVKPNILNTKINMIIDNPKKENYILPDSFSINSSKITLCTGINQSNLDKKTEWKDIKNEFAIELPPSCYKMNFSYEDTEDKNEEDEKLTRIMKNIYQISSIQIFETWNYKNYKIFENIHSCTGKIERTILKSLLYLIISFYFIEKNINKCNSSLQKIKKLFSKSNYQLTLAELAIINLLEALCCEKYLQSEEYYSKCVLLLLLLYGDPRGRNNDSHGLMQFPLWKINRKILKLEHSIIISEYFNEMYSSLNFFDKSKGNLNFSNNQIYINFNTNLYNKLEEILILTGDIRRSKNVMDSVNILDNNIDENLNFNFLISGCTDKDMTISQDIFDNPNFLELFSIKNFKFPDINEKNENIKTVFSSKDFIIYLIKEIQSTLIGNHMVYDEKYINEKISPEIFEFSESPPIINQKNTNIEKYRKTSETQKNLNLKDNTISNIRLIDKRRGESLVYKKYGINIKKNDNKLTIEPNIHIINTPSSKGRRTVINNYSSKNISEMNKNNNRIFSHFLYEEILEKLSFKNNLPSGIVISFGNNSHYETSHDNVNLLTFPRMVYKLKNIYVDKIYSGWEHNIILSKKGEIFSFGHNQSYQCGCENKKESQNVNDPINISIKNNNILASSCACGNEHTLILSNNTVYSFGNNEDGVLGMDENIKKTYKFCKINFENNYTNKIKSISAGTVHNMALTIDGKIFSWGSSQGGQLGIDEKKLLSLQKTKNSFYISKPTLISLKYDNNIDINIIQISCGEAHSMALSDKNKVYCWGFGSNGQLGLGFCEDSFEPGKGLIKSRIFTPKEVNTFPKNLLISNVQCGKTFTMFEDFEGQLYACGVNDLGQIGINDFPSYEHLYNKENKCCDFVIPTILDNFLRMKAEYLACGEGHCVAVIKDISSGTQNLFAWGSNKYGQLGLGDREKKKNPGLIKYLMQLGCSKFAGVSCGGFHSMVLIKNKESLEWIDNDFRNICLMIRDIDS